MQGRSRAERERIVILSHQIEVMARQKRLKPISEYLAGEKRRPHSSGKNMLAMMKRIQAKEKSAKTAP